jgi:hypothetical protein
MCATSKSRPIETKVSASHFAIAQLEPSRNHFSEFLVSTIRLLEKIDAQTKHLTAWQYIDFMENFGGRSTQQPHARRS